jgi:hypothetical protein
MQAVLTTCTEDKRLDPMPLPASRRYVGPRIDAALAEASRRGWPLLFLSGVYGIIEAGALLPSYDHALQEGEVEALVPRATEQLRALGVTEFVALLRAEETPGWAPYWAVLRGAASGAGVSWSAVVVDEDGVPVPPRR